MENYELIPTYKLSADHLTLYYNGSTQFLSDCDKSGRENLLDNENKYFELSQNARVRLKERVTLFAYTSENKKIQGNKFVRDLNKYEISKNDKSKYKQSQFYKIVMITLTLPAKQKHTDTIIKSKLLNQFLSEMKAQGYFEDYIWKAEKQDNGNIHFHIITNQFVKWQVIRKIWNRILNKKKFNYVDDFSSNMQKFFKDGFRKFKNDSRPYIKQYKVYTQNKKEGWSNPNTTDIVAIVNSQFLVFYLVKYIAKGVTNSIRKARLELLYDRKEKLEEITFEQDQETAKYVRINKVNDLIEKINTTIDILKNQGVKGRIWSCSSGVTKLKPITDIEHFHNIPNIEKVKKISRHTSCFNIGSRDILTYYFDIKKTPKLKQILDKHIIDNCL